jgi:DNA mismatch repair protein MutS2
VNASHLATLEFPRVLEQLASHTSFSASEALARGLQPASHPDAVRAALDLTAEARALLHSSPATTVAGARDVRPLVSAAERGRTLQPADLLAIHSTLASSRSMRKSLTRLHDDFPLLAGIASALQPCAECSKEIERCLDDAGTVRDEASPELARLRKHLRVSRARIRDKLTSIISSPRNARFLQEAVITQRAGRQVIPLKADFKGKIPGVVHDTSGSGATLFIEPLPIVELNNSCREMEIGEQEEVERILAALTATVASHADDITTNVEVLARLDLALAMAQYAEALEATMPALAPLARHGRTHGHPGSTVQLLAARHPLLDAELVVPIDVVLDDDSFVVVITGPNTGGKTVALKTLGLLAAMAQSGLHIPAAEGSVLSPFDEIYADIGDEQSIEQSLSTFSSHLTNILSFLDHADSHSLVLLDELGAGTDPTEGAALARALLDHFRDRQATTFVATHYPALKAYAQLTPGVRNACVEFDPQTLSPTYKLTMGLPGRSNALSIAERLGLPKRIADAARSSISRDDLRTDDMLADIHDLRLQTARARDDEHEARAEARELADALRERLAGIETERQAVLEESRDEAQRELELLRSEIRSLRRRLRAAVAPLDEIAAIEQAAAELEQAIPSAEPSSDQPPRHDGPLPRNPGDAVFVHTLGVPGEVISIEGDEAVVQVGPARGRFPVGSLTLADSPPPSSHPRASVSPASPLTASPSPELSVRGLTVDEALPLVDRHIDAAFRARLPSLRIVHGKGSGALRSSIRSYLDDHPLVSSYDPGRPAEGGDGVTVAHLEPR